MNIKLVILAVFVTCLLLAPTLTLVFADTLTPEDFRETSWSKTIDFFDYARDHASAHHMTPPSSDLHAYTQLTYINVGALQLLSWGLSNITTNETILTIPTQTTLMHFKTQNESRDVVTASSFVMLLAFNDTAESAYPGSPDMNDTLYASFSLGYNLSTMFPNSKFPELTCTSSYIPLTHSDDLLNWHWGMKYTNLTAFWWRIYIDPMNPHYEATFPVRMAVYDELTFTYNLTINPETHAATLTENHIIGRVRDFWRFRWTLIPYPHFSGLHYNSTGCYLLDDSFVSDETIYEYLAGRNISMSVIDFQTTFLDGHETYSQSGDGQNATDNDIDVSGSYVATYTDTGEKVVNASFGAKEIYNLFNYTANPTETTHQTYDAITRTCRIRGYAHNPIFARHLSLMRFFPLFVAHLYEPLYNRARTYFADMERADYFYTMSYPTYSGYRVEHDPTYTIYYSGVVVPEFPTEILFATTLILAILVAVLSKRIHFKTHRNAV